MKRSILSLALGLLASPAWANGPPATLRYNPPADAERPLPKQLTVTADANDYVVDLTFNRLPWGDDCKNRCASVTLFLDTDNNRGTGLQLGKLPETGADLMVTIQGDRDFKEKSSQALLRARVRQLTSELRSPEEGELIADLNQRLDPERLVGHGTRVTLRLDATSLSIPAGKTMRVVYHPPADKALEATTRGMLSGVVPGSPKVEKGKKPKRR